MRKSNDSFYLLCASGYKRCLEACKLQKIFLGLLLDFLVFLGLLLFVFGFLGFVVGFLGDFWLIFRFQALFWSSKKVFYFFLGFLSTSIWFWRRGSGVWFFLV